MVVLELPVNIVVFEVGVNVAPESTHRGKVKAAEESHDPVPDPISDKVSDVPV